MAGGRSTLFALSRLAKQWSEDDEEEQIRERRRRNRLLDNTGEKTSKVPFAGERSSSPSVSSSPTTWNMELKKNRNTDTVKGLQANELKKGGGIRPTMMQNVEIQKSSEQKVEVKAQESPKEESNRTISKIEETKGIHNRLEEIQETSSQQEAGKEVESSGKESQRSNRQEKDNQIPSSQREENKLPKSPTDEAQVSNSQIEEGKENKNLPEDFQKLESQAHMKLLSSTLKKEPMSQREDCKSPESQKSVSQASIIPKSEPQEQEETESNTLREESQKLSDRKVPRTVLKVQNTIRSTGKPDAGSAPSITSILSAVVTSKSPPPDTEARSSSVTFPTVGSSSTYKSQVFVSSVKITRKPSGSENDGQPLISPSPVTDRTEESAPSVTRTFTRVEIQIPPTRPTPESSKEDELLKSPPPTSPFRRFSPRTSSFRTISQSEEEKEETDSGLTRSSSLRFSLRSRKLGDRMEKYASAVQRSESVKVPSSQNRGIHGPSVGIASKRSIFEKDENSSGTNNAHMRKDLNISANVSSRINQWKISEEQQSSQPTSTGTKDIKTGDVATKRSLWQQRSQSSSDTKL